MVLTDSYEHVMFCLSNLLFLNGFEIWGLESRVCGLGLEVLEATADTYQCCILLVKPHVFLIVLEFRV